MSKAKHKKSSKTNRAARLLADNVSKLMNAKSYKDVLRFRKKLHSYSFGNSFLIYCQMPEASIIAGYRKWQELGRQVKKGERSLCIFAPLIRKDKESKEQEVFGFRSASVFDVSQTEGKPIPQVPKPKQLTGDSRQIQKTIKALEHFAAKRGNPVSYQALDVNGVYNLQKESIAINQDLPALQTLKTLIHEIAHAILHPTSSLSVHTAELEAESCAFLVCDSLGLDTSQYSFAYLAGWARDPKELLPAAERACKAANNILEVLQ